MQDQKRQRFKTDELAIVLSHYDLGVIESITAFKRGSRRSPKLGIVAGKGKFLLKRRDLRRYKLERVQFAHALQAHLSSKRFPLPALIKPVDQETTVLVWRERIYEMFEYTPGHGYRASEGETTHAGSVLAEFHNAMDSFQPEGNGARGDFHDALAVRTGLNAIPSQVSAHESVVGREAEVLGVTQALFDRYDTACEQAEAWGVSDMPGSVIHSDWHPGNMVFRNNQVAAVVDYDSARYARPIMDLANALLQFSMPLDRKPSKWPDEADEQRIRWFFSGYVSRRKLSDEEKRCLVPLMIEGLIAQSVVPIAATGTFGRLQGFGFLRVILRRVRWLHANSERLTDWFLAQ